MPGITQSTYMNDNITLMTQGWSPTVSPVGQMWKLRLGAWLSWQGWAERSGLSSSPDDVHQSQGLPGHTGSISRAEITSLATSLLPGLHRAPCHLGTHAYVAHLPGPCSPPPAEAGCFATFTSQLRDALPDPVTNTRGLHHHGLALSMITVSWIGSSLFRWISAWASH